MNYKALVAFVIMGGAIFQMYNIYVNGFSYNKLIPRDKHGFIIDSKNVKVTATKEALKAYKNLLSGEGFKTLEPETVPSTADGETADEGLPSLPPVAEETTETALLPPSPESENNTESEKLAETNEVLPEMLALAEGDSLPMDDETDTGASSNEPVDIDSVSQDMSAEIEENQLKNSDSDKENVVTEKSFDPVKELAKRNLMSCETKNSKGRIPSIIWNYIVKKSDSSEYLSKGDETLPEISKAILKDESCWPKLWSMNPQLENPYDIPSGITIFFLQEKVRLPANKQKD